MKIWPILVLVFSGFAGAFYIAPGWNSIADLEQKKSALEQQRVEKKSELERLHQLQKRVEAEQSLAISIPAEKDQADFVRRIQRIASQSGFGFSGLSFSHSVNPQVGTGQINAGFSVQGPARKLELFLTSIENDQRFLGIENLSVNLSRELGQPTAQMGVALYSFFQK